MQPEAAAIRQHDVLARDDEPLAARAARPQRVAPVRAARRPREGLHGRLHEVLLDEARREAAGGAVTDRPPRALVPVGAAGATYTPTPNAKVGDRGSVLPPLPSGTVWAAGEAQGARAET